MHDIHFFWLVLGMLCFLVGQIIRAIRWQILLPSDLNARKNILFLYVSIGSLFNIFLPLRIGEFLRAYLLYRSANIRFSTSIVSILIERTTDVVVVIALSLTFSQIDSSINLEVNRLSLISFVTVIVLWIFLRYSSVFKKIIYLLSSIWNSKIQLSILDFFWSLEAQISRGKFLSFHYITLSLLMWMLYLLSYYFFSYSISGLSFSESWSIFHENPFTGILDFHTNLPQVIQIALSVFLLTPIAISILYFFFYSYFTNPSNSIKVLDFISQSGNYKFLRSPTLFSDSGAFGTFLISHFLKDSNLLSDLSNAGFEGCKISRVFKGGSGAITAIVEFDDVLSIRKVVNVREKSSLVGQYDWLNSATQAQLPIVRAYNWTENQKYCFYEMPYELRAIDMGEWVHAVPLHQSTNMLIDVIERISNYHSINTLNIYSDEGLDLYLREKLIDNIDLTVNYIGQLLDLRDFKINDASYSIEEWNFLRKSNKSHEIIQDRLKTSIHGDLTLENIIITQKDKWMLIDPNPSHHYKTKLMDWAKLLQSLHLGYEFLNSSTNLSFAENSVSFLYKRSDRYESLYQTLLMQINDRFGFLGLREAYYHEIVHYLRLLPYKFREGNAKGILFFCATCILIRQFNERYEID